MSWNYACSSFKTKVKIWTYSQRREDEPRDHPVLYYSLDTDLSVILSLLFSQETSSSLNKEIKKLLKNRNRFLLDIKTYFAGVPSSFNLFTNFWICVVLPDLSHPSNTTRAPRFIEFILVWKHYCWRWRRGTSFKQQF